MVAKTWKLANSFFFCSRFQVFESIKQSISIFLFLNILNNFLLVFSHLKSGVKYFEDNEPAENKASYSEACTVKASDYFADTRYQGMADLQREWHALFTLINEDDNAIGLNYDEVLNVFWLT